MDFGSIFTSSASGSCKRRAMLTAPRMLTSRSGNSCEAYSLAEYTDAPASDTITLVTPAPSCLIKSAASASVSRLAVPLPIAINCTPCASHNLRRVCSDPSQSLRGSCGYTVLIATTLPVESTTATFTPVRMPGSSPSTTLLPAGAASIRSRTLSPNTLIATSSAPSRNLANRSRSSEGASFTFHVQLTTRFNQSSAARP